MVDWTKPVQLRNGWKAELLKKLSLSKYPNVVLITEPSGAQYVEQYEDGGRIYPDIDQDDDVINKTVEHVLWLVSYKNPADKTMRYFGPYDDEAYASRITGNNSDAIVHKVVLTR